MTHKVTQKMKHLESISEMLYTLRILTDHIATIQLATVSDQMAGVYVNQKKTDVRGI